MVTTSKYYYGEGTCSGLRVFVNTIKGEHKIIDSRDYLRFLEERKFIKSANFIEQAMQKPVQKPVQKRYEELEGFQVYAELLEVISPVTNKWFNKVAKALEDGKLVQFKVKENISGWHSVNPDTKLNEDIFEYYDFRIVQRPIQTTSPEKELTPYESHMKDVLEAQRVGKSILRFSEPRKTFVVVHFTIMPYHFQNNIFKIV